MGPTTVVIPVARATGAVGRHRGTLRVVVAAVPRSTVLTVWMKRTASSLTAPALETRTDLGLIHTALGVVPDA